MRLHILRRLPWLLLYLLALLPISCGGSGGNTASRLPAAQLQRFLNNTMAQHPIAGVVLAVETPAGSWRGASGKSDISTGTAMNIACQFRIGSISKQFLAALVLQLIQEGTLTLDDTIEHWQPGLVPNGDEITLRMLLNHTSGLYDYLYDPSFLLACLGNTHRSWTPTELVQYATKHALTYSPGTDWGYCNTGYVLLGMVVESATGHPLAQEMRTRFFVPLGMSHTFFATDAAMSTPFAHGYWPENGSNTDISDWNPSYGWAAGSIVSTADDLLIWTKALMGGQVLSATSFQQMTSVLSPAQNYGFGLNIVDLPTEGHVICHNGEIPGYMAMLRYYPAKQMTVVILTNEHNILNRLDSPEAELINALESEVFGLNK